MVNTRGIYDGICQQKVRYGKSIYCWWGTNKSWISFSHDSKVNLRYTPCSITPKYIIWLVVSTHLKNISQLAWLFPIYGKIIIFQTTNQSFTVVSLLIPCVLIPWILVIPILVRQLPHATRFPKMTRLQKPPEAAVIAVQDQHSYIGYQVNFPCFILYHD